MKTCTKCGAQADDSQIFCMSCGAPLPEQTNKESPSLVKPASPETISCPICGATCDKSLNFCLKCGASLHPAQGAKQNAPVRQNKVNLRQPVYSGIPRKKPPVMLIAIIAVCICGLIAGGVVFFAKADKKTSQAEVPIESNNTTAASEQRQKEAVTSADTPKTEPRADKNSDESATDANGKNNISAEQVLGSNSTGNSAEEQPSESGQDEISSGSKTSKTEAEGSGTDDNHATSCFIKGTKVNMRAEPHMKAAIVFQFPGGEAINVIGISDPEPGKYPWYKVSYEDHIGWVYGKFIREE